jgi:hypothetical protein
MKDYAKIIHLFELFTLFGSFYNILTFVPKLI